MTRPITQATILDVARITAGSKLVGSEDLREERSFCKGSKVAWHLLFANGMVLSIQGSEFNYCDPRGSSCCEPDPFPGSFNSVEIAMWEAEDPATGAKGDLFMIQDLVEKEIGSPHDTVAGWVDLDQLITVIGAVADLDPRTVDRCPDPFDPNRWADNDPDPDLNCESCGDPGSWDQGLDGVYCTKCANFVRDAMEAKAS